MNMIAQAEGIALYAQSTKKQGEESDRLFQMAMSRFASKSEGTLLIQTKI